MAFAGQRVAVVRGAHIVVIAVDIPYVADMADKVATLERAEVVVMAILVITATTWNGCVLARACLRVAKVCCANVAIVARARHALALLRNWIAGLDGTWVTIIRTVWYKLALACGWVARISRARVVIVADLWQVKTVSRACGAYAVGDCAGLEIYAVFSSRAWVAAGRH